MYHILVSDDHPLFQNAISGVIKSRYPDAKIATSNDLDSTISSLERNADIDLLLLDLHMPGSQDLFGLILVRDKFPSVPVAILSADENLNTVNRAMGHGACGYIPKSCPPETIQGALQSILDGEHWLPPGVEEQLSPLQHEELDLAGRVATLTPQQYKVLCYLREGWLNKQIGYEIGVTEATVKAHITAIFKKLGISNRTQAVIILGKMSLEKPTDE